ncbi:uncharacterized protein LOC125039567 isoform X2 [Penaeus chinensis]|uniref:uncharacterized protein LOC125039567 isoform X2 n=1 Tax=Penaeus chinensis TaxID=139456 RepID=UPI001FB58DC3|nr:uncharacterized protein LOC125039567 isoform X2 [Penaeus chinensis]
MQPPLVILLISAFMHGTVTSSAAGGMTDDLIDCRIYTLGVEGASNKTPTIPFRQHMTVSFFNAGVADSRVQTTIHLVDSRSETGSVTIFINRDAEVILRSGGAQLGVPLKLPPPPSSFTHAPGGAWTSLVVSFHDFCLVVYSQEDPVGAVITADVNLKGNISSFVASNTLTYLVLDCPAGCHVHDGRSPLVDRWLPLPPYLNLFVSVLGQNASSSLDLAFKSEATGNAGLKKAKLEVGRWRGQGGQVARGEWHRVQITRHAETSVAISWAGDERRVDVPRGRKLFRVARATAVVWSLYCFPDVARGQEAWLNHTSPDDPPPNPDEDGNQSTNADKEDQEEGADEGDTREEGSLGEGQVWAWVLTGLAFFLVMILALALCTRMKPRHEVTSHGDYLPSIGIVSHRHIPETGGREAEEMSEPGSPTIPATVINHKLPEENDHSTKKL